LRKEIEERSEKEGERGFEKKGKKEHFTNTKQKTLKKRKNTQI
jgi:hypothetical protein